MDYADGRDVNDPYGYMQGTSMACPHVVGTAALALSYAKKLGRQFTLDEFVEILLSQTRDIDDKFEGSKKMGGYTLQMADYKGKMGGLVDMDKLFDAVEYSGRALDAPEITLSQKQLWVNPGETDSMEITVSDPAGKRFFTLFNDPDGILQNEKLENGTIRLTLVDSPELVPGAHYATLTATNVDNRTAVRRIAYIINRAPTVAEGFHSSLTMELASWTEFNLLKVFTDTVDDSFTLSVRSENPEIVAIDHQKFSLKMFAKRIGTARIVISATDSGSLVTEVECLVSVRDKVNENGGWL